MEYMGHDPSVEGGLVKNLGKFGKLTGRFEAPDGAAVTWQVRLMGDAEDLHDWWALGRYPSYTSRLQRTMY